MKNIQDFLEYKLSEEESGSVFGSGNVQDIAKGMKAGETVYVTGRTFQNSVASDAQDWTINKDYENCTWFQKEEGEYNFLKGNKESGSLTQKMAIKRSNAATILPVLAPIDIPGC